MAGWIANASGPYQSGGAGVSAFYGGNKVTAPAVRLTPGAWGSSSVGSSAGGTAGSGDARKYHDLQVAAVNQYQSFLDKATGDVDKLSAEWGNKLNPDTMAAAYGQDAVSAHDNATAGAQRTLARFGINPASGAWQGMENSRALARAALDAGARNRGRWDAMRDGFRMLADLQNMRLGVGRGYGDIASMWGDFAAPAAESAALGGGGGFSFTLGGGGSSRRTRAPSSTFQQWGSMMQPLQAAPSAPQQISFPKQSYGPGAGTELKW